jgi:hypothetical protein
LVNECPQVVPLVLAGNNSDTQGVQVIAGGLDFDL